MKWDFDINQKQKFDDPTDESEEPSHKTPTAVPPEKPERYIGEANNYVGMNWHVITKIGHIQFALACVSSLALMLSLTCAGFSFFRFTSSAWSTYLLSTAYIAIRAGRWNSYAHVIAYCGMVTFQTVVYMSSLCWLAYSLYALEYQMHVYIMQRREFELLTRTSPNIVLVLMVVEVVAMIGTVFTGVFGMIACCRGLGKLLHQQEQMIMEARFPQPQITVRPI